MDCAPDHRPVRLVWGKSRRFGSLVVLLVGIAIRGPASASPPIFENQTPTGFSTPDSTAKQDFIEGDTVGIRVDLNQAATPTYPVIGHFHNLERSLQVATEDVDGMRVDVALTEGGIVHLAWISQEVVTPVTTPVYSVVYARSNDSGQSFSQPVSVSGSLRFDILSADGAGVSFSTLDIEVDSRGNPRVVYAFNHSPDGRTAQFSGNPDNIYFNYSENGGASWLPGNSAVVVNDTATVGNTEGLSTAFPRLAIDQRDNVFVTYVRGASAGAGADDIMLARVSRSTSPFTMEEIGSLGTAGSSGGVRLSPDGDRQTGPDISVGSGDVLHLAYFNDADDDIEHKSLLADDWQDVDAANWDQNSDGADIDDFDNSAATNAALETDALYYFPTVVVDQVSVPDKIYSLYKFGDATYETIFFNSYIYDNGVGGNAGWSTGDAAPVWSTASTAIFASGNQQYNVELEWTLTERVAAVVDERRPDQGDLHIVFSAGYSSGGEHDIYYGYYNGSSWTLPEKVADDDSDGAGTEDGIAATDVYLGSAALAQVAGEENLYLAFVGGVAEGLGIDGVTDANHHPYLKVLGRDITSEDESVPVGAYQYDLSYTPINGHISDGGVPNQAVYVHVADHLDGTGLGASGAFTDGFLAGEWETVGTTLADDDKSYEGEVNEDGSTTNEWGDDDDKVGLLVKLNVLGSDSSTNLQVVTNSTASASGTGLGARTVRVGSDPTGSFVVAGSFFALGADIDIVDANSAPIVAISAPDGSADQANLSYRITYDLIDSDDDIASGDLEAGLYFAADSSLATVQDIRIFGTLIVDQNDNSAVFASGSDDFSEGADEHYTWDEPSEALQNKLFASILKVPSGSYYIYLVADDGKNPPVFSRSPGALTILHTPIIDLIEPVGIDTVDTGVRSGDQASPYDLDFRVRDFERQGSTQVQLFYSAFSGLSSVSASGVYPEQNFVLGKSLSGTRGVAITNSDTLTSTDTDFLWDLSDSVYVNGDSVIVSEGTYYVYLVASDSANIAVGQSEGFLAVKHSPSFTFYEPAKDTHKQINTGSQPVYTLQWQKGRGDYDFDDDANIDFYFTSDNPATINYEDFPDSLLEDADTRVLVKGLSEDGDGADDIYVWDLRSPPNDVPADGTKVWLYAVLTDAKGNSNVALGGALTLAHDPYILLTNADLASYGNFNINERLRLSWDDYLVDDGVSTDNAYIRLYALVNPSTATTLQDLETAVDGVTDFLLNSDDGSLSGTITTVREDSVDFFDWNTSLFGAAGSDYDIYAAISKDPTFNNNSATTLSKSATALSIAGTGSSPNIFLSPADQIVAVGDTLTIDVMLQYSLAINFVQVVLALNDDSFSIIDQSSQAGSQPFVDLDNVFAGSTPIENTYLSSARQIRFSKSDFAGDEVGVSGQAEAVARFQLVATDELVASPDVVFSGGDTGTVLGLFGKGDPLDDGEGLSLLDPELIRISRGQISAVVELEGRTSPLGDDDHSTLLDVHLRLPGSTEDIADAIFLGANDDFLSTTDTLEVETNAAGALSLISVPAGRYVLTVKDTSHVSGRTDTIEVRNGETVTISSANNNGFFGSDLRGDPTSLLPSSGTQLIAGDVSQDNEINEDDVNLIIAAWGTAASADNFAQADINNDEDVGASDLIVTTSNFGNSEGFGAPPVYKPALLETNSRARVELVALGDGIPEPGSQVEFALAARDLAALAGFEAELRFDPQLLQLAPEGIVRGDVFLPNPRGAVFEVEARSGRLRMIGARIGKGWSASGDRTLARLRFDVVGVGGLDGFEAVEAVFLDPLYRSRAVVAPNLAVVPQQVELGANYPNPFNPETTIPFALNEAGEVRLEIYNVLGQKVNTLLVGPLEAGFHTAVWSGLDLSGHPVASGVYFYRLQGKGFLRTDKMVLLR